jgi:hypothetical protein
MLIFLKNDAFFLQEVEMSEPWIDADPDEDESCNDTLPSDVPSWEDVQKAEFRIYDLIKSAFDGYEDRSVAYESIKLFVNLFGSFRLSMNYTSMVIELSQKNINMVKLKTEFRDLVHDCFKNQQRILNEIQVHFHQCGNNLLPPIIDNILNESKKFVVYECSAVAILSSSEFLTPTIIPGDRVLLELESIQQKEQQSSSYSQEDKLLTNAIELARLVKL